MLCVWRTALVPDSALEALAVSVVMVTLDGHFLV
jgi:hypothetical protein